jgi:hypothetical protein
VTIDLGAIFDAASVPIDSLIRSTGTTVSIGELEEGRGEGTTDPDTLVWTPTDPSILHASTPALVAPMGAADLLVAGSIEATATPVQIGLMIVVLLPEIDDVAEQHVLKVLTCRDPRLVGRTMDIVTILDSSAGVARVLHARPRTLGPGGS